VFEQVRTAMKKTTRHRKRKPSIALSDGGAKVMSDAVERHVEHWLRHLIIVDPSGTVRRLTEAEVQHGLSGTRSANARDRAKQRRLRGQAKRRKTLG